MYAAKANSAPCVTLLANAGANLEIVDREFGTTAFLIACEHGCASSVSALAAAGANVSAVDKDGTRTSISSRLDETMAQSFHKFDLTFACYCTEQVALVRTSPQGSGHRTIMCSSCCRAASATYAVGYVHAPRCCYRTTTCYAPAALRHRNRDHLRKESSVVLPTDVRVAGYCSTALDSHCLRHGIERRHRLDKTRKVQQKIPRQQQKARIPFLMCHMRHLILRGVMQCRQVRHIGLALLKSNISHSLFE